MNVQDFNFNFSGDRPAISEPIPDGTILYLSHTFTPGGYNPPGMNVDGALTRSKQEFVEIQPDGTEKRGQSDVAYLKSEFTVLRGPWAGRKFWGNLCCVGGEKNERGESKAGAITRGVIRSMLDSSQGLSSKDESPEASAKRVLPKRFMSLQGVKIFAKVKLVPANKGYPVKNELGQVLTIDMASFPGHVQGGAPDITRLWQEIDHPKITAPAPSRATMAAAPSWATPVAGVGVAQIAPAINNPFGGTSAPAINGVGTTGSIVFPTQTAAAATPPATSVAIAPPAIATPAAPAQANGSIPQWMQ